MLCRLSLAHQQASLGARFRASSIPDMIRSTFAATSWLEWTSHNCWMLRPSWCGVDLTAEAELPKAKTSFAQEDPSYQEAVEAQRQRAASRARAKAIAAKDRVRPGTRWSNG